MTTSPKPPEPTPEKDTPRAIMQMRDLRKLVSDTVESAMQAGREFTGTGQQQDPAPRTPGRQQPSEQQQRRRSIDDEVTAALSKIEKDKERQQREDQWDKDITDLKTKVEEKPPVERRRVHGWMRWGE